MEKYQTNGYAAELAQFETPFSDVMPVREHTEQKFSSDGFSADFFTETESPFSRTYEAVTAASQLTPAGEEYLDLVAELNDHEFQESLYEMANEMEDSWRSKVSNETAMGSNFIPFATQQARDYLAPVITEAEAMIDRVANHFSGNNLADQSEASLEALFETLEFNHGSFTPAQEQFFGKIFKKVKSVVKKGVALAKKGIAAVGKILPMGPILKKLKGLIRPLLDKVLKFAIGKLPKNLQPYAQTLANKLLNLKPKNKSADATQDGTSDSSGASAQPADALSSASQQAAQMADAQSAAALDAVQTEFDNTVAQLLFSADEGEAENVILNYEQSDETLERLESYETGYVQTNSFEDARQQFIDELKNLQPGESPAPAIEKFLPAAILALQPVIKIALKIIGRQKVINFLAGLLAKLVGKYVPENVAKPLAAGIIDIGMSAIGFETYETGKSDLAYEAIANTIAETVQNMTDLNEATINNSEALSMHLLEAFEQAAANNFPPQYIKEELRPSKQRAVWVAMPRQLPVKLYKKFTHVFTVSIDPKTAGTVTTFRNLPLANFLRDKYGIDTSTTVQAKVHLYETCRGGRTSHINKLENLPGLNAKVPKGWVQLLPLTKQAAALLLKEPGLGKDVSAQHLANRFRAKAGQRFYYLEIDGARLRIPPVNRSVHKHGGNQHPAPGTESRSADVQGVINFPKSEIKLKYYFSEEDAKEIVEKLNKNDFLGGAIVIRKSVKEVLNDMLKNNASSKVKIIHEAIPELYLENLTEQEGNLLAGLGKLAGKELIAKLIEHITGKLGDTAYSTVVKFFKERAAEFKQAQAAPQDGVTVVLTWSNVGGMGPLRAVLNAIRNDQALGNLGDLSLPSFTEPAIHVFADKRFD